MAGFPAAVGNNTMISVTNLSYYIGGRALYENASMFIKPKDKIGLIGLNGRGKSTLLRLINGDYTADAGSISKSNDCTIGFLNQDLLSYQTDDAIVTVAMEAFRDAVDTQREIEKILHKLEHEGWIKSEWRTTEHNRRARYYLLTRAGERQLSKERSAWERTAAAMGWVLGWEGGVA